MLLAVDSDAGQLLSLYRMTNSDLQYSAKVLNEVFLVEYKFSLQLHLSVVWAEFSRLEIERLEIDSFHWF